MSLWLFFSKKNFFMDKMYGHSFWMYGINKSYDFRENFLWKYKLILIVLEFFADENEPMIIFSKKKFRDKMYGHSFWMYGKNKSYVFRKYFYQFDRFTTWV